MHDWDRVENWFLEYGDDVYRFLIYYTGTFDVEDAVQEVFLRAAAGSFKGESSPKTWLLSIAKRYAVDQHRQRKKWRLFDVSKNEESTAGPEKLVLQDERLAAIYAEIDRLRASYRQVLLCRLVLEYSVDETADILGWPKPKVSVTYHRALARLRKNLQSVEEGGVGFDKQ